MLNRSALILRPKPPFIDWARRLDNDGALPEAEGDHSVYLVPEILDDSSVEIIDDDNTRH